MKTHEAVKKPIVIQFITYPEVLEEYQKDKTLKAINGIGKERVIKPNYACSFTIKTLEGDYNFTKDDVLIIGVSGEFYPCKIDIFKKTYGYHEGIVL